MRGIAAYGAYVPYWRLDRKAIATALGAPSGSGTRSVASYDEDTTSLGVEAARAAVRAAPHLSPEVLYFATAQPAYLDKTNATAIHAALDLAPSSPAYDMAGAVRSGAGALGAALDARRPALAVLSDIRTGLPGGADEREGGDGGVAFLCCEDTRDARVLAEPVAFGSATAEFLERWRLPGEPASRQWEERFGEHVYVPLGESAVTEALKQAGVTAPSVTQWVIAGPHARAAKRLAASLGATKGSIVDDLATVIGNTGTAHAGLLLAHVLDTATPDALIAVVSLADGCDVTVWRATSAIAARRPATTVATQLRGGGAVLETRAAAAARPATPRGAARRARRGVEVCLHREPLPGVRRPAPAAAARVREMPRGGPDGARAPRRRPGDDRDVHGGPARVFALAARRGGGHRF